MTEKITDLLTAGAKTYWQETAAFMCHNTCTKGHAVSVDALCRVTNSSSLTLHRVIGIAMNNGTSGDLVKVLLKGYCDFADSGANGLATTDMVVIATNGGTIMGLTQAELTGPGGLAQLGLYAVGVPLASADADGIATIWVGHKAIGAGVPATWTPWEDE